MNCGRARGAGKKLNTSETLKGVSKSVFNLSTQTSLQLYEQCKSVNKLFKSWGTHPERGFNNALSERPCPIQCGRTPQCPA